MTIQILKIAKKKGIKYKKLAELLNIDYSTFWRKVKGYSGFSEEQLNKLSSFLGVSVEDLTNENTRI